VRNDSTLQRGQELGVPGHVAHHPPVLAVPAVEAAPLAPRALGARILELIVPGGFERYFAELGQILGRPGPPDLAALAGVAALYELDMDPTSIPRLAATHGLVLG
jgi:hypothetical protein